MVILSKIICNSVLKQYWEYRISRAKAINIDLISQNILSYIFVTVRTLQGLWYFTTTLCMYLQRLSTFKLLKNMSFFYILYILIKKILKILYWGQNLQGQTGKGPKPLGPNRKRAETSGIPWIHPIDPCDVIFIHYFRIMWRYYCSKGLIRWHG